MTRSEPYKKNDNMCTEERNNSIARKHLGYVRLDEQSLIMLAGEILETACLIHNPFRAVQRMIKKVRVSAKWHRTYEKVVQTPYVWLLAYEEISRTIKVKLRTGHDELDPLSLQAKLATLKKELDQKLFKNN